MKKIKLRERLVRNYLPLWAKETVFADNRRLEKRNKQLEEQNQLLRAYIAGMREGLRAVKNISDILTEEDHDAKEQDN